MSHMFSEKNEEENMTMESYLESAAIAVELTADLSFGTVMLVAGELKKHNINKSITAIGTGSRKDET